MKNSVLKLQIVAFLASLVGNSVVQAGASLSVPVECIEQAEMRPYLKKYAQEDLLSAVSAGDRAKIEDCLKNGADVNKQSSDGYTALMYAKTRDAAELLIKAGAKINLQDKNGKTALMYVLGDLELLKLFIAAGADVNLQDKEGETVLIQAMNYEGNSITSRYLLKHAHVDINKQDKYGISAFMMMVSRSNETLIGHHEYKEMVRKCLELKKADGSYAVDLFMCAKDGKTVLDIALTRANNASLNSVASLIKNSEAYKIQLQALPLMQRMRQRIADASVNGKPFSAENREALQAKMVANLVGAIPSQDTVVEALGEVVIPAMFIYYCCKAANYLVQPRR